MAGSWHVPDGYGLVRLEDVDSTNAEAVRRANAGEAGPLWICAAQQTLGRGRQGRDWVSEPGNLYASLLLRLPLTGKSVTGLSFVAALAAFDAADAALAGADPGGVLSLKWPNDLMLDRVKTSGILLEAVSTGADTPAAVTCGIGMNVSHHPNIADYETTDLHTHGAVMVPGDVFTHLSKAFVQWFAVWDMGEGFTSIRREWLERAAGIGEDVRVKLPGEELTGTFIGLDDDGAMILRDAAGGEHRILAGDLFLGATAG